MSKARRNRQVPEQQPVEAIASNPSSIQLKQALLLAAAACLLYAPTWQHGFAGDDWWVIVTNQWTRKGLSALPDVVSHSLYFGAVPVNGGLYRPFAGMYYVVVGAIGGLSPTPYHVATTLLYGLNAALVFLFFTRLVHGSVLLPIVATLLFIVHPIHTEVVNNIKSSDEMLCLGALFASYLAWLRYADTRERRYRYFSLAVYAIAVCSKETAVPMVVMFPALWYFFRQRSLRESAIAAIPFAGIALLYVVVRHLVLANEPPAEIVTILNNSLVGIDSRSARIASALGFIGRYLWMLAWPHPLSFDYTYNAVPGQTFADPMVWLSIAACIGGGAAFVIGARSRSLEAFAALWLACSLVLVSNLFFLISTNFGERLLYLPSVIVSYVAARLLLLAARATESGATLLRPLRVLAPLVVLLTVAIAATVGRTFEWRDEKTLFRADVKKYPNSAALNTYVGHQYYIEGETLLAGGTPSEAAAASFANAKQYLLRGLAVNPDFSEKHAVLGMAEFRLKQCDEALPHLERSLSFAPYHAAALQMMAGCYEEMGNHGRALEVMRQIDAEGTTDPQTWFALGNDAAARGEDETSIRYFTKVVIATPDDARARYNLANAAYRLGRYSLSFDAAQRCSTAQVLIDVRARCLILAGNSLARLGRTTEAKAYVQQARTLDPTIR